MTPRDQHLETVRKACIAAVPEIVELKFGCVYVDKRGYGHCVNIPILTMHGLRMQNTEGEYFTEDDIRSVTGRPITLADVLLVIQSTRVRLTTFIGDHAWFEVYEESNVFTHEQAWKAHGIKWNLREPLTGQDDATLAFLANLLTPTL